MPQPGSLSASRNRQELVRERKSRIMLDVHFCSSACFNWSSMEEKKRHSAPAEAIAPFSAWGSPKETMSATEYCSRSRSVAHCALSSSIFAVRRSDAKRAIPPAFWNHRLTSILLGFSKSSSRGRPAGCHSVLGGRLPRSLVAPAGQPADQLIRHYHIFYIVS